MRVWIVDKIVYVVSDGGKAMVSIPSLRASSRMYGIEKSIEIILRGMHDLKFSQEDEKDVIKRICYILKSYDET